MRIYLLSHWRWWLPLVSLDAEKLMSLQITGADLRGQTCREWCLWEKKRKNETEKEQLNWVQFYNGRRGRGKVQSLTQLHWSCSISVPWHLLRVHLCLGNEEDSFLNLRECSVRVDCVSLKLLHQKWEGYFLCLRRHCGYSCSCYCCFLRPIIVSLSPDVMKQLSLF